jgi:purine-binding chemotaxis protein CheW
MTTMTASSPALAAAGNAALGVHAGTREYLSFKLGAEEYGIDILKVQEIQSPKGQEHRLHSKELL